MIQPNEKGFLTNVALVYDKDGKVIKTGLPITTQVAPSGLWPTLTELAEIAIEIQNALRNKKQSRFSQCRRSIPFKNKLSEVGVMVGNNERRKQFCFFSQRRKTKSNSGNCEYPKENTILNELEGKF